MKSKIIDCVIFDLDGTLIDSAKSIVDCYHQIFNRQGIVPKISLDSTLVGPPLLTTVAKLLGTNDAKIIGKVADEFVFLYDEHFALKAIEYAGAGSLLAGLKNSGKQVHLVTNKRLKPTNKILEHLAWGGLFDSVYAIDSSEPSFPGKQYAISALLAEKNIPVDTAIYIGDMLSDYEASTLCGLDFQGVSWGYGNFDGSISVVESFAELNSLLS